MVGEPVVGLHTFQLIRKTYFCTQFNLPHILGIVALSEYLDIMWGKVCRPLQQLLVSGATVSDQLNLTDKREVKYLINFTKKKSTEKSKVAMSEIELTPVKTVITQKYSRKGNHRGESPVCINDILLRQQFG